MASISSLMSSGSSSSIYGSRSSNIISGLASGLDTESLIEGMVQGIKSKIDKQKQQQTILGWQQQAYRSISDQLVSLSTKYTSYTSSTNLMSEDFFSSSIITTLGKYADKISASGTTNSNIEIKGAEMAKNESITFTGLNGITSNQDYVQGSTTGVNLDPNSEVKISNLAEKNITFKYGSETFSITFPKDGSYNDLADVKKAIDKQLEQATVSSSDGKTIKMSDKINVSVADGKLSFGFKDPKDVNTLEIASASSSEALVALGLAIGDKIDSPDKTITSSKEVTSDMLYQTKKVGDVLAGATMNITFNGKSATIRFPEKDSKEYNKIFGEDVADRNKAMEDYLQNQVDQAFGYGRIDVSNAVTDSSGNFSPKFELTEGNKGGTISITSGSLGVVGEDSIFGIDYGTSNRINTDKTLEELGLGDSISKLAPTGEKDENGNDKYAFEINGVEIGKYSKDTKLSTIISDINNSDAGVKVTYSQTTDQFVFTATHGGAGGKIEIDGENNLAAEIFGAVKYSEDRNTVTITRDNETITSITKPDGTISVTNQDGTNITENSPIVRGQDATLTAIINGQEKVLTSDTNTFNIDGFAVTVNGAFTAEKGENVTFNKAADTDKVVDAIKSFVEEYNKMLEDLGEAYTTQPNKDYTALTDDQKAEMTEKQIEEYEKKAKEGILFADSDLKSLASDLRFLFSDSVLEEIGITTSTEASDRGKLSIDESKLRAAIESDPEKVQNAFAAPIETGENGNVISGGAMPRLKQVLDKYAATTGAVKGILIEKAGSQFSPVALLNNEIKSEIEDIDEIIDKLTDQLNDKIDFYTSKFSKLEVLISQMNSQSSYLAGMSGGY